MTLRQQLEEVTKARNEIQFCERLQVVIQQFPDSVRLLSSPHPIGAYTCLLYALGFTEKPEYVRIADYDQGQVFAGADFAHWLVDQRVLTEVSQADATSGDLVMYFSRGRFKHVGVLVGADRVVSKWGRQCLLEHHRLAVPQSYGTEVRFFRALPYDVAMGYFTQYAEDQGVPRSVLMKR